MAVDSHSKRRLATAETLADFLGIPRWRIYYLVRDDMIPHVRMGRQVRFDLDAVERWIKQGGDSVSGQWRERT